MRGDLDKLVAFVKNEFPVNAGEISDAIELLSLALDGLLEHTSIALTQSQHDRNFAKSKELVSLSEEVSDFQSEIIKWSNGLQDEVVAAEEDDSNDTDEEEDTAPREGNPLPNYAEYRVDQSVPHTLYESFTHKKACAFTFCGRKYQARDWKDLLIQVCDLLSNIDPNKIMSFIDDRSMVGSRIHYFGTKHVPYKNEKLTNTDVYVWINLSSNGKRNIIRKMLKKFNIPITEFLVYLRADYTPLHPSYRADAEIDDNLADDEKVGAYVRNAMRKLSEQNVALSKADLSLMLSKEGTKRLFDVDYPFLKPYDASVDLAMQIKENGYGRYWKEVFILGGKKYLVTSQWYERSRDMFKNWFCASTSSSS